MSSLVSWTDDLANTADGSGCTVIPATATMWHNRRPQTSKAGSWKRPVPLSAPNRRALLSFPHGDNILHSSRPCGMPNWATLATAHWPKCTSWRMRHQFPPPRPLFTLSRNWRVSQEGCGMEWDRAVLPNRRGIMKLVYVRSRMAPKHRPLAN